MLKNYKADEGDLPTKLDGWIECKERMPECYVEVLLYDDVSERVLIGCLNSIGMRDEYQWDTYRHGGSIFYHGKEFKRITHWQPKPDKPLEKGS